MGRHLIVTATFFEIRPLFEKLELGATEPTEKGPVFIPGNGRFDMLVTGVGQMLSAYHLGAILTEDRYASAAQFGIGGSFRLSLPARSVVSVVREDLADLGAEDGDRDLDLFEMGLLEREGSPFSGGTLSITPIPLKSLSEIPTARSVTVNRVLAREDTIRRVVERFDPDVVNMEGAAFFYACLSAGVPCMSLRSISDRVGPRDKSSWDIPGAIASLAAVAGPVIDELSER